MTKIQLLTRTGRFVAEVFVPSFAPMPDAFQWGNRYFARREGAEGAFCEITVFMAPLHQEDSRVLAEAVNA